MDNISELVFVFKNLPQPAIHNILTFLPPEKAIRLCNFSNENKRLCKDNYDVWIERINSECLEYEAIGENINSGNAYDKYVECTKEHKRLDNISKYDRLILITRGNLRDFIRSNPVKEVEYFQWACMYGHLDIAKWIHNKFNITEEEVKAENNWAFRFACMYGHLDVAKWLHKTFHVTDQEARMVNNFAFKWACWRKHYRVIRWMKETFDLELTPEDIVIVRGCL